MELIDLEKRLVVARVGGVERVDEVGEEGQKVETSSYSTE